MTESSAVIEDVLKSAASRLRKAGVDAPILDAQIMMARAINASRECVVAHPERVLTRSELARFGAMLESRVSRCPLAYVVGCTEFFGLKILIRPGVLVPRPETETLVEAVLKRFTGRSPVIADVGTGSGAVAVALAANLPSATVYATEISPEAAKVARANIENLRLTDRVTVLEGEMIEPVRALGIAFDAVVSNPPYVPGGEIASLQPEISLYEPAEALDGGPDGLDFHRLLLPASIGLLREGGFAALECGAGQAGAVCRIARRAGYCAVRTVRDLAGIERVVIAAR